MSVIGIYLAIGVLFVLDLARTKRSLPPNAGIALVCVLMWPFGVWFVTRAAFRGEWRK